MMFKRRIQEAAVLKPAMDTSLIGKLEYPVTDRQSFGAIVKAVLFATGELRLLDKDADIYGLVLAGYEGHRFGDDGTYTANVATELPLERWDGVKKLEKEINEAVRAVNPAYCAEHVGFIALDEAAVFLDVDIKRGFGITLPPQVSWSTGTLSTGG